MSGRDASMTSTIAIVTGAAGDIGRAIAARLGADHDVVLLVDIDLAALWRCNATSPRPRMFPGWRNGLPKSA
jgi:NAD(P)-dependent dehydrogenase (short-subunit alcohol dehydrogenase family)